MSESTRVSLADAARILGLSERTIRRRIHNGSLPAEAIQTQTGPRWLVQLPDGVPVPAPMVIHEPTLAPTSLVYNQQSKAVTREAFDELRADVRRILALVEQPVALPEPDNRPAAPWWWRRLESMLFGVKR